MQAITLIIGNMNYSSWSLRAWLPLAKSGVSFDTVLLPLDTEEFYRRIPEYSPTGCVPVLWHGEHCVWDSLAIAEYINEHFAGGSLWPEDAASRALGRSMAAEMHSGFTGVRNAMPMNIRARRVVPMTPDIERDIARISALWTNALDRHAGQGPWLLGQYSIADAMFAPVVFRFATYGVQLPEQLERYCAQVMDDPDLAPWLAQAATETWIVEADEAGEDSA